jgi:hypothetical protein
MVTATKYTVWKICLSPQSVNAIDGSDHLRKRNYSQQNFGKRIAFQRYA